MKKGFVLIELLVALLVGTIVLTMIFDMYTLFSDIDNDGLQRARTTYNINTIKQMIINNPDKEYYINESNQLCIREEEIPVINLNFMGEIIYSNKDEFKTCLIKYDDKQIEFIVSEKEFE